MKKLLLSFSILLLSAMAISSCSDGDRIDQRGGLPLPQQPKIVDVKSVPGGAVLKFQIPDDPYLKGIVATYERNGAMVESRISRYLDTLMVEGYADLQEHAVEVRSFNADDVKSEAQTVKITPLEAPISTAKYEFFEAFGGFKVKIKNNPTKAQLALVVQADTLNADQDLTYEQRKWKDVSTLFMSNDSVVLTRRGMSAVPTVLAVHLRDNFGNVSPTQLVKITPKAEAQLDKSKFKHYPVGKYPVDLAKLQPGADNFVLDGNGGNVSALWDNVTTGTGRFFLAAKGCPIPTWLTIDLGVGEEGTVLSRIKTYPRSDYLPFQAGNIRQWEFWGIYEDPRKDLTENPASPSDPDYKERHGFSKGWVLLSKGEQYKPSGYAPDGTVDGWTSEDREYYLYNTEYEVDNSNPLTPHAYNKIRYLRIVVINTFATWQYPATTGSWFIGEITPWGQVNK